MSWQRSRNSATGPMPPPARWSPGAPMRWVSSALIPRSTARPRCSTELSRLRAAVPPRLAQPVERIIIIAPQTAPVAGLSGMTADVPLLAVGCGILTSLASVAIANVDGALVATRYLLGLGHRTVHHLAGPAYSLDAQERVDGWREALRSAGAALSKPLRGDWSARSGYELGLQLAPMPGVTAVFCGNDQMALGLLRALSERSIRVPRDVSVVGFDDIPES